MVEVLRALGIRYIALNPGASYRGLHDSLVNFGHGEPPEIILCTHEEIAVALANGYTRATGEPMATGLHNVVGLLHASMAIFNAWCERTYSSSSRSMPKPDIPRLLSRSTFEAL